MATATLPRRTAKRPAGPAVLDAAAAAGVRRAQRDPAAWLREWLGADLWAKQVEIAEAVRDCRRVAVRSCHSSGKSFLAARIVLWFLHAWPNSVVITTAPTFNQVQQILWRELRAAVRSSRLPLLGRCLQTQYDIAPTWYALGFKSEDTAPDRFQGFHAAHSLVVIDEAAGVAEAVYEALTAVLTSEESRLLLIGNPTSTGGRFYEAFHGARALYRTITIAAADTPNLQAGRTVRPYLITQQWIDEVIAEHGADSPYVQARVFAVFPGLGQNTLLPLQWLEAARHREGTPQDDDPLEAGLDVARFGDDSNAFCVRRGERVVAEHAWSGLDTMQTVGRTRELLAAHPGLRALKVDVVGVGSGVADRLRELKYPVVDVNVGAGARDPKRFVNLRCELWWGLRERVRQGLLAGPIAEATIGQLATVRYSYDGTHTGPVIESKEQARKRGVKSPDRAEALLLAFAQVGPRPPTLAAPVSLTRRSPWTLE